LHAGGMAPSCSTCRQRPQCPVTLPQKPIRRWRDTARGDHACSTRCARAGVKNSRQQRSTRRSGDNSIAQQCRKQNTPAGCERQRARRDAVRHEPTASRANTLRVTKHVVHPVPDRSGAGPYSRTFNAQHSNTTTDRYFGIPFACAAAPRSSSAGKAWFAFHHEPEQSFHTARPPVSLQTTTSTTARE